MKKYYIFVTIVWFVAVFLIFSSVENPFIRRKQAVDKTIIMDMSKWSNTIESYYVQYRRLPESLKDINRQEFYLYFGEQESEIDYKIKNGYQYQLCAEFLTDTTNNNTETSYNTNTQKKHKEGYDCIDFEVSSSARNDFSATPVLVSSTPIPSPTPYESQSVNFYVQSEYEVNGTNTYLRANLSEDMAIEYSKDESNGGKTIIHLNNEPLLDFAIVTKNNPTHFLSYKKLDGSRPGEGRYLVSIASSKPDEVEYHYTNAVSIGSNCSNQGVVEWPCGPISIYSLSIHFIGDLKDIEIANNVVSSLEFL